MTLVLACTASLASGTLAAQPRVHTEPNAGDVAVVVAAGQIEDPTFGPPMQAQVEAQPQVEAEPARAEPAAELAVAQAAVDAQSAAQATDPNAPAVASSPSWLAPQRSTPAVASGGGSWAPWILLLTLSAVGGALYLQRNKARQRVKKQFGKAEIHVLASSRIGPKAQAVAIEFGGQVYLLGVTDSSVRRLETLSKEQVQRGIAETSAEDDWDEGPKPEAAPPSDPDAEDEESIRPVRRQRGAFRAYLDQSMNRAEPSASPAEQLAQNLTDRTSLKGRGRTELVDIEGQAAGLAARLNSTVKGPKRPRG